MSTSIGDKFIDWASRESSVQGLIQIGSRVRTLSQYSIADEFSDWDFQVVTSDVTILESRDTYRTLLGEPLALAVRSGRLASSRKITILFMDGEIDLVIIPARQLDEVWALVSAGHHTNERIVSSLEDLSLVLNGGYRILKGSQKVSDFYSFVRTKISFPKLTDGAIIQIAEAFVCDYVSTARKIARGEFVAAQRWLHHYLIETNFRLCHEYRQRSGLPSFPDARRIESLLEKQELSALEIQSLLSRDSMQNALEKSAQTCRVLMQALVGTAWRWPTLPSNLSGK